MTAIFTNIVPTWVSALFLISFMTPVFLIASTVKQATLQIQSNTQRYIKLPGRITIFILLYFIYTAIMSYTGIFQVNMLPPKILLFTGIPLIIFYFLVVFRSSLFWKILEKTTLSNLVRIHTFRFVGIFFIIGWYYQILPKSFALIGGLGDIFVAITAIIVARLIDKQSAHYKRITLVWNIIGFWDIISVLLSAMVITKQAIATDTAGILEMTKFPFSLIPAFAPATIIFLHICIFKKLKMK